MLIWGSTERDKCCEPNQEVGGLITRKQWEQRHRFQASPINPESERESNLLLVIVLLLIGVMVGMAGGAVLKMGYDLGQEWAKEAVEK